MPLRRALGRDDVFTVGQFNGYANAPLASDELRKSFNVYENTVSALYEARQARGAEPQQAGRTVSASEYLRG